MTDSQRVYLKLLEHDGLKLKDYSFVIYVFDGFRAISDREPVSIKHNFPSVRSAVCYMDSMFPHIYYYDIQLVNEPVNCPTPYNQIL